MTAFLEQVTFKSSEKFAQDTFSYQKYCLNYFFLFLVLLLKYLLLLF